MGCVAFPQKKIYMVYEELESKFNVEESMCTIHNKNVVDKLASEIISQPDSSYEKTVVQCRCYYEWSRGRGGGVSSRWNRQMYVIMDPAIMS